MLRLRLAIEEHRADSVAQELEETGGVHRIVALTPEHTQGVVLAADVLPSVADRVVELIRTWELGDADYLLTRQEVVAPRPAHGAVADGPDFAWIEVIGEATAHARPLGRYLALIAVAAIVAAVGVITDNPILIVGAMAISPDLLPICAACVGVVGRRGRLALRSLATLVLGVLLTWAVAAAVAWSLQETGVLTGDFEVMDSALQGLNYIDYSTILVALAAGIAAMLSFETRAAAAVGVAISVTTIPASALFGVSLGLGEPSWGAAGVLAVNITLLLCSGSTTLAVQWASLPGKARPP